jgi:hypothetical protein
MSEDGLEREREEGSIPGREQRRRSRLVQLCLREIDVFDNELNELLGASVVERGRERRDVLGRERGHSGEETVGVWRKKRSRGLGL